MANRREAMGYLGDGEINEETLTIEQFLEKYPDGVFRPEPPVKELVEVKVYPAGDAVGMYEGN